MIKINGYTLSNEALDSWCQNLVPAYDFLYFREHQEAVQLLGKAVPVFPRKELNQNLLLFSIDVNNAFTTWNVKKEAQYVAVVPNELTSSISPVNRQKVYQLQWEIGRGLIFDLALFESYLNEALVERDYNNNIIQTPNGEMLVLQKHIWDALSQTAKTSLIVTLAEQYIKEQPLLEHVGSSIKQQLFQKFSHISSYFDTLPGKNGPNCFASVLAACATHGDWATWIIQQWVQPETFQLSIKQQGYNLAGLYKKEDCTAGDILVWLSDKGEYIHTAYVLNEEFVFNKHGQTIFNPWQVLTLDTIIEAWANEVLHGGQVVIFRK